MATELFPIIATGDVDRSLAFYRDLLGGRVTYEFPGPDGRPLYVALDLGSSQLGIAREPAASPGAGSISLWVYVDDCDRTVGRLRAAGTTVLEEPVDQAWGERVAKVEDPDRIVVHVASRPR